MGDHLETEQKYDADADFVLPKLGGRGVNIRQQPGLEFLNAV